MSHLYKLFEIQDFQILKKDIEISKNNLRTYGLSLTIAIKRLLNV